MRDCKCGKPVRLRATKIRVNRKNGVAHRIEHTDGSSVEVTVGSSSLAFKPYPKSEDEKPWKLLVQAWDKGPLNAD